MPDITITDAEYGLVQTMVARSERVSPHIVRVTFSGGELDKLVYQGFDQWFRLALPISDGAKLENVPTTFGFGGLLTFMALPKDTRPVIRNDTIRDFRAGSASAGSCGASDGSETEMKSTSSSTTPKASPDLRGLSLPESVYGFTVGESGLIKAVRRHLVRDRGVPKSDVTFCSYWKIGTASPS